LYGGGQAAAPPGRSGGDHVGNAETASEGCGVKIRRGAGDDDAAPCCAFALDPLDALAIETASDQVARKAVGKPSRVTLGQCTAECDPMHCLLHRPAGNKLERIEKRDGEQERYKKKTPRRAVARREEQEPAIGWQDSKRAIEVEDR